MSRLFEHAGENKALMVWCCIISTLSVFFELVPFLAMYKVLAELLRNAADISSADTSYMIKWAGVGIIGLLLGYACMYFGGMMEHTAAYRTLYNIRIHLSEHRWAGLTEIQSAR